MPAAPVMSLTVWKLDRLGRSLLDLVGLVEVPEGAGCRALKVHNGGRGRYRHDETGGAVVLRHVRGAG